MAIVTIYLVGNGNSLSWTPPSSAAAKVEVWGAGQAGNTAADAGASGGYSVKNSFALTAGSPVSFQLGAPGKTDGQNGGDTWFGSSSTVIAAGGGSSTTPIGDTTKAGTAGVLNTANAGGGAGGGSGAPGPFGLGNQGGLASINTNGGGGGGGNGGGAVGGSTSDAVFGASGGDGFAGGGGPGGSVGALFSLPNGGAGALGAGGGGGYGDASTSGTGGAGGDDFNNGGGGGGSGGQSNGSLSNGGNGGTPGGGGGPGYGTGVQGQGGASVIKITYTGTDPNQTLTFGDLAQGTLVQTTGAATLSAAGKVLVRVTLSATTGAATLSATALGPYAGTLALTAGAATLSSAGTVLVRGTLSLTTANATLSSGGAGVAGALTATTANATLTSVGKVLVQGTLTATTQPAVSTTIALTIDPIIAQPDQTPFAAHGTFNMVPVFSYADDLGAAAPLPVGFSLPVLPVIPWGFTHPGLAAGAHTLTVTEVVTGAAGSISVIINGGQSSLNLTAASATLQARADVIVTGGLTATTGAATLASQGVTGSATLRLTLQDATLVGAARVPVIGKLHLTLSDARIRVPSVPLNQRGIQRSFPKGLLPVMAGGDTKFTQKQTDQLASTMADLLIMTPQAATEPPVKLFDAMKRLARAPWRPAAGQTGDAWVYWDGASQLWKLEGSAPTNT